MIKVVNGKEIDVNVLGGFKIDELDKEYVICSYDDDETSNEALIVILQVENTESGQELVSIPYEEKEMVMLFYQELKEKLLKGE